MTYLEQVKTKRVIYTAYSVDLKISNVGFYCILGFYYLLYVYKSANVSPEITNLIKCFNFDVIASI